MSSPFIKKLVKGNYFKSFQKYNTNIYIDVQIEGGSALVFIYDRDVSILLLTISSLRL